jgi:hypothetical protein
MTSGIVLDLEAGLPLIASHGVGVCRAERAFGGLEHCLEEF